MTDSHRDPAEPVFGAPGTGAAPGPSPTGSGRPVTSATAAVPPSAGPLVLPPAEPAIPSAAPRPRPDPLPGRVWGIVSLALAVLPLLQLVGLVAGIIGLVLSSRAGRRNWFAVTGIAVSMLLLAAAGVFVIAFAFSGYELFGGSIGSVVTVCSELGRGEHVVDGLTYTCG